VTSGPDGPRRTSMEEGLLSLTPSSLSEFSTSVSVSTTEETIDSLDKSPTTPANDLFLGQNFVSMAWWQGENMRYLKPDRMTLYDLALLANVVHLLHPKYVLLRGQSYSYADLIYTAIKQHFGVHCSEDCKENQNNLVYVDGSCLSNKYGRYKGVMINRTDPEDVSLAINSYKEAYAKEMHSVIL
jgi:hypothetical protein